jgi:phage FluMu protein Com
MINGNKCPKCEKVVFHTMSEDVPMHAGFTPAWSGLSHACPHCRTILSVEVNPMMVRSGTVSELLEALRKSL